MSITPGYKLDEGKLRYDLLPPEMLEALAYILTVGSKKYADRNWENGMSWGRVFAALMRHLWAWWSGSSNDEETGKSHLWHAACCLAFLVTYEARKIGKDDRPTTVNVDKAYKDLQAYVNIPPERLDYWSFGCKPMDKKL